MVAHVVIGARGSCMLYTSYKCCHCTIKCCHCTTKSTHMKHKPDLACAFLASDKTRKLQQVCWCFMLPCSHQTDIRMCSQRLLSLDDNKSAASCQQAWCKLILETFYPQVVSTIAASLQMSSCIEPAQLYEADRLDATRGQLASSW